MKKRMEQKARRELQNLCNMVRMLAEKEDYAACGRMIRRAMEEFPHAPQPHNLMGIILEREGNHSLAMRHFRAAWALEPTYLPVKQNLNTYGTFFSFGKPAFDESDVSVRGSEDKEEQEGGFFKYRKETDRSASA